MAIAARVRELEARERPLVLGGDFTLLLGVFQALPRGSGLWFIDGHADFLDGKSSPTGEAADMDLAILTGDNADSQQYNETRWFIDILDGTTSSPRTIDPNSGIPVPGCEATPGSIYDGVRDSGQTGAPDLGYY